MKALSVRQPWAWLIVHGHKRIENRTWRTRYRGPLLIHAGRSRASIAAGRRFAERLGIELPTVDELAFGAIVGIVNLDRCVELEAIADDPFAEGPICWELSDDVRAVEPVAYAGELGLFNVPEDVVDDLRPLGSRVVGIEPPYPNWKPGALPLS